MQTSNPFALQDAFLSQAYPSTQFTPFFAGEGVWRGKHPLGPMLTGMILQTLAPSIMAPYGLMPMGVSSQNLLEREQRFLATQAWQATRGRLQQYDTNTLLAIQRGLAASAGIRWTAEAERRALTLTQTFENIIPYVGMIAPDLLDQIMGERGSANIFGNIVAGTQQYRFDTGTGRPGWETPTETAEFTASLFSDLFGGSRWRDRQGLSAIRFAQMHAELNRRGLLPGQATIAESFRQAMSTGRMPEDAKIQELLRHTDELNVFSSTSTDPAIQSFVRGQQVRRVSQKLRDYQGAVRTIMELFGGEGRTNVPMAELFEGLNALSGGSLGFSQVDPQILGKHIRLMGRMAQNLNMGFSEVAVVAQEATALTKYTGISSAFAPVITTQGLAAEQAYRDVGMGTNPVFGAGDSARNRFVAMARTAAALNSTFAMQQGTFLRLQGISPGVKAQELEQYFDAVAAGKARVMPSSEFLSLVSKNYGQELEPVARTFLSQIEANQAAINQNPAVVSRLYNAQIVDYRTMLRVPASVAVSSLQGMPAEKQEQLIEKLVSFLPNLTSAKQSDFLNENFTRLSPDVVNFAEATGLDPSRARAVLSAYVGAIRSNPDIKTFGHLSALRQIAPDVRQRERVAQARAQIESLRAEYLTVPEEPGILKTVSQTFIDIAHGRISAAKSFPLAFARVLGGKDPAPLFKIGEKTRQQIKEAQEKAKEAADAVIAGAEDENSTIDSQTQALQTLQQALEELKTAELRWLEEIQTEGYDPEQLSILQQAADVRAETKPHNVIANTQSLIRGLARTPRMAWLLSGDEKVQKALEDFTRDNKTYLDTWAASDSTAEQKRAATEDARASALNFAQQVQKALEDDSVSRQRIIDAAKTEGIDVELLGKILEDKPFAVRDLLHQAQEMPEEVQRQVLLHTTEPKAQKQILDFLQRNAFKNADTAFTTWAAQVKSRLPADDQLDIDAFLEPGRGDDLGAHIYRSRIMEGVEKLQKTSTPITNEWLKQERESAEKKAEETMKTLLQTAAVSTSAEKMTVNSKEVNMQIANLSINGIEYGPAVAVTSAAEPVV